MKIVKWQCDTCLKASLGKPWKCPGCNKEICGWCFWAYSHCKSCCVGKTDEQLKRAANEKGDDFD